MGLGSQLAATPPQSPFLEPRKAAKGGEGPAQPPALQPALRPGGARLGEEPTDTPQADTRHGAGPEDLVGRRIAGPRPATRAPSGPGGSLASPTRIPPPPRSPAAAAPTPATARVSAPPVSAPAAGGIRLCGRGRRRGSKRPPLAVRPSPGPRAEVGGGGRRGPERPETLSPIPALFAPALLEFY